MYALMTWVPQQHIACQVRDTNIENMHYLSVEQFQVVGPYRAQVRKVARTSEAYTFEMNSNVLKKNQLRVTTRTRMHVTA